MTIQLSKFVEATELVSFDLIKQACQETLQAYTNPIDLKACIEDLEAIIIVGHACDRLYHDIESIGSIDILLMLHNVKSLFYSSYSVKLRTDVAEQALAMLMTHSIEQIIDYCDESIVTYEDVIDTASKAAEILTNQ